MNLARARTARLTAWLALGAALSACGKSTRSELSAPTEAGGDAPLPSDGTQGGTSGGGTGGASARAGGAGDAGTSKADACIAYTTAECERRAECLGTDAGDCFSATRDCPDALFSAGSTRTVSGVLACAVAYGTFSCDELKHSQVPACATPGTLEAGATCEFSAQCASLTCVGSPCGTCAQSVGAGEACASEGVICAAGFYCGGDGRCAALPAAPAQVGDACTGSVDCPDEAYCGVAPGSSAGTCTEYPDAGASCADSPGCRAGTYCDLDQTCRVLPGENAECGVDASTGRATWCSAGLVCSPGGTLDSGTCLPLHGAGEACVTATGAVLSTSCAEGFYCDTTVTPATCSAPKGGGELCSSDAGSLACESGYRCTCADTGCSNDSCLAIGGYAGAKCDGVTTLCHPAFQCDGAECLPRDTQGFARSCVH